MKKYLFLLIAFWLTGLALPIQAATYGPVAKNETLWKIAARNRPSKEITTQQMMMAIFKANPKAFARNNINALQAGAVLYIPNLTEVQLVGPVKAIALTKQQNQQWKNLSNRTYSKVQAQEAAKNIAKLKQQLQQTQAELRQERRKVKALQNQLAKARRSQPQEVLLHTVPDTELAMKVQDLETIIQEKNVHISQLQTMVDTARETIKRQAMENEIMYNKLKAIAPSEVQNLNVNPEQFSLTLQGLDEEPADQSGAAAQATTASTSTQPTKINADRFAMILAIISLVLLLIFLWRAYSQMESKKAQMAASRLQEHQKIKSSNEDDDDNKGVPLTPPIRKEPSLSM